MTRYVMIACSLVVAAAAVAADISVTPTKLIVVDKLVVADKAKAVFVVKDAAITKGAGLDVAQIGVQLDVRYDDGSATGAFVVPVGASVNKSPGWLVNKESVAKYVNKTAPDGPDAKVAVIKPGKVLKLVGKGLGDTPLDILAAGAPAGSVFTAFCVDNAGEENCHCSEFTGCVYKSIAGDTGAKLVCKTGTGDGVCTAAVPPTTTTTTTVTTTTTNTTICSGTFCDLGDGTVIDSATNLQWEQKTTTYGSGTNLADPHDVDNRYRWSGLCTVATSKRCQPDAAAETTCKLYTDPTYWADGCEQCVGGEGTCDTAPWTTVWEWLNDLNGSAFAGHTDWRLPDQGGCNTCWSAGTLSCNTCTPSELETILLAPYNCGPTPCIDPIFGPTNVHPSAPWYWSSATYSGFSTAAWSVNFTNGWVDATGKYAPEPVRAVRGP